jgi:hypothetical protein
MMISPGVMVRITQDAWESTNGPMLLEATEGSIAKAMSYEEYCDYINKRNGMNNLIHLEHVKEWMKQGEQFPFMLIEVAPISEPRYAGEALSHLKAGEAVILDGRFIQIVDG